MNNFAAVIFDMDGVLVHSEPLHRRAYDALYAVGNARATTRR